MNITANRIRLGALPYKRVLTSRRNVISFIVIVALALVAVHRAQRTVATGPQATASKQPVIARARMSDEIKVHAAGRGNPYINLSGGHELITPYSGSTELIQILERNEARGLSLCSADFDEDGLPDLISGYAGPSGGIITLLRGNVDSIYPNAPEAKQRKVEGIFTNAPFLSPAFVFGVPGAVDFIGAGDFDGDSHWDVVAAARGSRRLYLMSGDGKGGLCQTKRIDLPGEVTTMVVAEINRRDGLGDVVVGVSSDQGPKVLVFEGPEGALMANPETFNLPAEATSLALGQLDDSYEMDLVIAAGHTLMLVHGRDRKLSLDAQRQAEISSARVEARVFPFRIASVAVGDFSGNHITEIALLSSDGNLRELTPPEITRRGLARGKVSLEIEEWNSTVVASSGWSAASKLLTARVSSTAVDNIVVVDTGNQIVEVIARTEREPGKESAGLGHDPERTLRVTLNVENYPEAVISARLNADALSDLAVMQRGSTNPSVISTAAAMTFTVINTNDSGSGSLRQAILDANSSPGADAINFSIGSGVQTIRPASRLPLITDPVTIDGTTQPGFAGNPIIELDGGDNALTSTIVQAGNSTLRGLVINRFETGTTLSVRGGNVIEGNFIGTDVTGTVARGNNAGIFIIDSPQNTIGGNVSPARNVISGNRGDGIQLSDSFQSNTTETRILGNFIGTNRTGTILLGNSNAGVHIVFLPFNNTIGGTTAGARNTITGSQYDIELQDSSGNIVQGNLIGTDVTGTSALGGNSGIGVFVSGVNELTRDNTIGGTIASARNIISGHSLQGILIASSKANGNQVQGNFIGTDISGNHSLGNGFDGITITGAPGNVIGGATSNARNVISGNEGHGIGIGLLTIETTTGQILFGQSGVVVLGNFIGSDQSGTANLGNRQSGIFVENNSISNTIDTNLIAFNGENGVRIPDDPAVPQVPKKPAVQIRLLSNSIHSNGLLGIDLGPPGVTPNPGNRLTGANLLQNFPELASAVISTSSATPIAVALTAASITIAGTLNASPSTVYTLQLFFGSNCTGQGPQFSGAIPVLLGSIIVTTDGSGIANYSVSLPLPTTATRGGFVNATATDPVGNTSELSQCVQVTGMPPAIDPKITNACKGDGKQLIINGIGFVDGAKVFLNGEAEKTQFVSSTQVVAFKAGKRAQSGDALKVRNPDTTETSQIIYSRVKCSP